MGNEASLALKEELRKVHDSGLNIYMLINRTKRELRNVKAYIPDQVLMKVCERYWFEKNQIRRAFPWFIRVLKAEWTSFNANAQIREHAEYKKDFNSRGGIEALDSILTRVMGKVNKSAGKAQADEHSGSEGTKP